MSSSRTNTPKAGRNRKVGRPRPARARTTIPKSRRPPPRRPRPPWDRVRLRKLQDDLETTLWFRPALWVIFLGFMAQVLIAVDRAMTSSSTISSIPLLFTGDASGASTLLVAIGSTVLTVATLAFSIIMVAVVQAANAYSPRLLHQYLADASNQNVLGLLIGTFLYSLLVLRVVNAAEQTFFIPTLAITGAVVLFLASMGAFIYFINHIAHSIEVDDIINLITSETSILINDILPSAIGSPWAGDEPPTLPTGPSALITAEESGYIQFVEPDELLASAVQAGALLRVERMVGEYVLPGTPLVRVWPPEARTDTLTEAVQYAFYLGSERTLVQDIHFGLRQLSDIALRALSPAVNDPSTAINCVDALAGLLADFAQQEPVSPYRCSDDGTLRVVAYGPTFASTLDQAFTQVRQYGAGDFACTLRLIEVYGQLAYSARRPSERAALWQHLGSITRMAQHKFKDPCDRLEINTRIQTTAAALDQEADPLLLPVDPNECMRWRAPQFSRDSD